LADRASLFYFALATALGRRPIAGMASDNHSMIFATGEPAYAVAGEGTIVAWNAAARKALGYSAAQAVGQKCWELLKGKDAFGNDYCGKHCPLLDLALHGKPVNRCRMSFRTASEEVQPFTVTTLVLFDTADAKLIHLCRRDPASNREALSVERTTGTRGGGAAVSFPRAHHPGDCNAAQHQHAHRA
jgi:PAS domain-containing protein